MRRGCISLGNIQCDQCGCVIPYPERYLSTEEGSKNQILCMKCCKENNLVKPESDKEGAELIFDLSDH